MDLLSNVLEVLHLDGALFLNGDFSHPWRVSSPCGQMIASAAMPHVENVVVYHLITEGNCIAHIDGEDDIELEAGDIVMFPHGDAHDIGSHLDAQPLDMSDIIPTLLNPNLNLIKTEGSANNTRIICGWLSVEQNKVNPLVESLPRLVRVNIRQQESGKWLENSISYAVESASSDRVGTSAMTKKLAELLFLETLRIHIETIPEEESSWLAGVSDKHVGKVLELIHSSPGRAWTVESLAQEAFISRSVLAEKFKRYVRVPPMQYLMRWRLAVAASMLRQGNANIIRIIEEIGYESETAFNRAFKREFGMPPGSWRSHVSSSD